MLSRDYIEILWIPEWYTFILNALRAINWNEARTSLIHLLMHQNSEIVDIQT